MAASLPLRRRVERMPTLELSDTEEPSDEETDRVIQDALEYVMLRRRLRSLPAVTPATTPRAYNRVQLHIYDLISSDTMLQLPWGCICQIGKCVNSLNAGLYELGTGAYHVGVEVNGIEYAYGATSIPNKSGIFSCFPKCSPGYQYRTTIDFGKVTNIQWNQSSQTGSYTKAHLDGRHIIERMTQDYVGTDYDIWRKNCCTFAHDACVRLGIRDDQIPHWFRNLAATGAYSQDVIIDISKVLAGDDPSSSSQRQADVGIEVMANGSEIVVLEEETLKQPVVRSVSAAF